MSRITLTLLKREYTFDLPETDHPTIQEAARLLNLRAEKIAAESRSFTSERIAVATAMQIAFDALRGNVGTIPADPASATRITALTEKIKRVL